MNVFIITEDFHYEGSEILQVFSESDKADEYAEKLVKERGYNPIEIFHEFGSTKVWEMRSMTITIHTWEVK